MTENELFGMAGNFPSSSIASPGYESLKMRRFPEEVK